MAKSISTGVDGGSYSVNVQLSETCNNGSVRISKKDQSVNWVTIDGLSFTVASNNTEGSNPRSTTIETFLLLEGGEERHCSSFDIEISQEGQPAPTCVCDNLTVSQNTATTHVAKTDPFQIGTYSITSNCSQDDLKVTAVTKNTEATWLTITSSNNSPIMGTVTANPSTTQPREATITISSTLNGVPCPNKKIKLTQYADTSCQCSYFTVTANTEIPAAGGTVTAATYGSSVAGCSFNISVVNIDPNPGWLHIGDVTFSNGVITGTANPNTGGEREATIAITGTTSDGKNCTNLDTITVKQKAVDCTCSKLTVAAAANIPATGDTSATLGTISDGGCVNNVKITNITYQGTESGWISNTNSGSTISGEFTLTGSVADWSSQTSSQARTATVTVTGSTTNNPNCTTSFTITQDAAGCTCDNAVDGDVEYILDVTEPIIGNEDIDVWKAKLNCGDIVVYPTGDGIETAGLESEPREDGYRYITAHTSDVSSQSTFKLDYAIYANGECTGEGYTGTTGEINVDPALVCDCEDLVMTYQLNNGEIKDAIENKVYLDAEETGDSYTYTISYRIKDGKEDCFNKSAISIEPEGEYDTTVFHVHTGNTEDGVVWLKTYLIKEPENDCDLSVAFNYGIKNGPSCTDGITNIVKVHCDKLCSCTKIKRESCVLTTVPLRSGTYYIGSGETHSCGTFEVSAYSESNVESTNVEYDELNPEIAKFYITFKNATEDKNSDILIKFKYDEGNKGKEDCEKPLVIVQTANYLNCERLMDFFNAFKVSSSGSEFRTVQIEYTETEKNVKILSTAGQYKITSDLFNEKELLSYSVTEGGNWLSYEGYSRGETFSEVEVKLQPGSNCSPLRTGKIKISLDTEKAKNYGLCDCEVTEIEIPIQEIPYTCIPNTTRQENIASYIESGGINLGYVHKTCLEKLEIRSGDTVIQQQIGSFDGDSDCPSYVQLPGDYSWISVRPCLNDNSYAMLNYKTSINSGTEDRTAVFNFYIYFKNGTSCSTACTITQSKAEPIVCENAYSISTNNVGVLYNIESATTPTSRYALSCEEQTRTIACYTRMDKYSIPGIILSATTDATGDWLTLNNDTISPSSTRFKFNVSANKTPIRDISLDYDGSTNSRTANITLLLMRKVGDEYVLLEDDNGITCPGVTFPICQKGFSGYCPTCQSITKKEEGDYVKVDYTNYGDSQEPYDDDPSLMIPCFIGDDGESEKALFECEFNIVSCVSPGGTEIRCFDLIPESDNIYIIEDSLRAQLKENETNKYIVYGKLEKNKTGDKIPISIRLYVGKRDFLNDTVNKCEDTLTLGLLKLLNEN